MTTPPRRHIEVHPPVLTRAGRAARAAGWTPPAVTLCNLPADPTRDYSWRIAAGLGLDWLGHTPRGTCPTCLEGLTEQLAIR